VEIRDRHDGVVPREVEALLALTGIGDYTARAVAVFAYGERHPVVDTNTRASSRGPSTDALSRDRRLAVIWRRWRRCFRATIRMPRS
jgi:adenine-specific DNA glycosylase